MERAEETFLADYGFQVQKELSSGSQARVYLAKRCGRLLALKRYTTPTDEHLILKNLKSQYVVRMENCLQYKNYTYISTRYIPGETAWNMLQLNPKIFQDINLLDKLATDMMSALVCLKEQQVVHRDITPNNIIYNYQSFILIDFGLGGVSQVYSSLTGTVYIYPPLAIIYDDEDYDLSKIPLDLMYRNDLYALGVTLYFVIHGEYPRALVRDPEIYSLAIDPKVSPKSSSYSNSEISQKGHSDQNINTLVDQMISGNQSVDELLQKWTS